MIHATTHLLPLLLVIGGGGALLLDPATPGSADLQVRSDGEAGPQPGADLEVRAPIRTDCFTRSPGPRPRGRGPRRGGRRLVATPATCHHAPLS